VLRHAKTFPRLRTSAISAYRIRRAAVAGTKPIDFSHVEVVPVTDAIAAEAARLHHLQPHAKDEVCLTVGMAIHHGWPIATVTPDLYRSFRSRIVIEDWSK
jgi:predicted nucleic acid-binding protein